MISKSTILFLAVVFLFGAVIAWAGISGSISGVVTDPSGAVVVDAAVSVLNTQTGIQSSVSTDSKGFYNFPALPIGTYDVEVHKAGFKTFRQTGLVIDANSAVRVDVKLELGQAAETVTVTSEAVHVETQSTQMGEVITGAKMTAVPLNGRAFTDLLSLQPGVSPYRAADTGTPGLGDRPPSGDLNSGNEAINGQRETANGFMVNGATVEEGKNNGAAVIPNLDSIAEFRIISNNFDAEYGNYSGGQVNVATKSGTNQFHGSAFDFLRNTALDARNYFDTSGKAGVFIQNQFGGTLGAPIKKDKAFFFVDYQGSRRIQAPTQSFPVPSMPNRTAAPCPSNPSQTCVDLSDGNAGALTGSVSGAFFAQVLQTRLQTVNPTQTVTSGEPYFFTSPAVCTSTSQCVFPGAVIPTAAFSAPAATLINMKINNMNLIPTPTPNFFIGTNSNAAPQTAFSTSAFGRRLPDDKGAIRLDGNTRFGALNAYYFIDDFLLNDPFPNGGASAPGFSALTLGRAQLLELGETKSFGSTAVNEFHFSFLRDTTNLAKPKGGLGITLTSLGFPVPASPGGIFNGGIAAVEPTLEGVPSIGFNNFSIGVPSDTGLNFNNTFQWQDNFTKIFGTHSLKFGGQFHYDQINERNFFGENGFYSFNGSETGSDFADFLIGAPNSFIQASRQILDSRTKYMGLFIQDSWRAKPSLTLNYGLRWEFSQPWYDTQGKIQTIIPGQQSVLFPGAPLGWVMAGDPGVPKTLAPTRYNNFSPRVGLAFSPSAQSGFLAKLTGGPDKTSIRLGAGIFYTAYEDLSQFLEVADAPFGLFWVSPAPPLFETPYIDRATGFNEGQKFPFVFPPPNVSAKNPDTSFNWANVEPISSGFVFFHKNRLPYAEHYDLSIQRQVGSNTVITLAYVGTQGHRLPTSLEANSGSAALCSALNAVGATPSCGPFGENTLYVLPPGTPFPSQATPNVETTTTCASGSGTCNAVTTTRTPLGPAFGSNPYEDAMANSAYNSVQASVRHASKNASFLGGYTFGRCLDNASGLQDSTNPFNYRASRALCNFDVQHNFVTSYIVRLPFDALTGTDHGWVSKIAGGWSLSGITTFATGLPVSLSESDDLSLAGVGTAPVDLPQLTGKGPILNNTNPRSGQPYFNTSLFTTEPLGQIGNASRRFFHGPGINNWDMALLKDTKITESKSVEFRFEAFNIFNHAQFNNPGGSITAGPGSFGIVSSARDPRIMQAALKFHF